MIYCVIPPELADDLYDKLVEYYKDTPNVEVSVDRRVEERRDDRTGGGNRIVRDRRRGRIPGSFPRGCALPSGPELDSDRGVRAARELQSRDRGVAGDGRARGRRRRGPGGRSRERGVRLVA